MPTMIERQATKDLIRLASQYPIVTITGPRQSGKSTLARSTFKDKRYLSFEDLDIREEALSDPRGFLNKYRKGVIFDEIQRVPALLSYMQTIVDEDRINGQFILTGSQQFELMEKVSQSLAGRTAILRLLPFSYKEIRGKYEKKTLSQILYTGMYPRIYDQNLNPTEAMSNYFSTYIERDVRQIINIKDIRLFETFLKILAGRSGQLLNTNNIATECGISHNTVKSWIAVLEASFIIFILPPYYKNINKRLIKMPKMYFYDTGLLCYLLSIYKDNHLESHPLKGSIFETYVISEMLKNYWNNSQPTPFYFYRDHQGNEVDLLIEEANNLQLLEIKSSQTLNDSFYKGMYYLDKIYSLNTSKTLVYGGAKDDEKYKDIRVLNWENIDKYLL